MSHEILEFNGTSGDLIGTFASTGSLHPSDLLFAEDGNLLVSDIATASVLEFNGTTGVLIGSFASGSGLGEPTGLAIKPMTDCNENGVGDAEDISSGFSPDVNSNGVPDECEYVYTDNKITAGVPEANHYFGANVSLDGDRMAVASRGEESNAGAVYVYDRVGGVWTFDERIQPDAPVAGETCLVVR